MALDVYREIPSVLISTALGLRPRAVLISTSGIFPVYRLKPCVNLYLHPYSKQYTLLLHCYILTYEFLCYVGIAHAFIVTHVQSGIHACAAAHI